MSRRNNLLYYGTMRGARGVQLLDDASDLFRRLAGSRPRPYHVDPGATDIPEECEKRLNRLRARAREAFNDRGTHVLYVAFGMLRWKESATSDETISSPLVLVPVELKREGALGTYSIARAVDEEIEVNPTLAEKFRHDFGVQLPGFAALCESAAAGSPTGGAAAGRETLPPWDALLAALDTALRGDNREIAAEVHLGIFSFQKLVMYQDMKRHTAEVLAHPLLRLLGGERLALPRPGGLYPAEELDRKVPPRDVLEILDADSSQQEAIVAAKAGASFVLRGPPGTGKSQTIGNIIAECLGQGRSVLFVSEKRAALEVVGQRLSDAGLGDFLLDLHSHNTDKKQLITDLAQALTDAENRAGTTAATDGDWERASDAVARSRGELNDYIAALHRPRVPLDRSVWDAYGVLAQLAATPDSAVPLTGVGQTTREQHAQRRRALEELLTFADVLDRNATHPWRNATITDYSLELEGNIRAAYTQLNARADSLDETLQALAALLCENIEHPTFADAIRTLRRAGAASLSPRPPETWLETEVLAQLRPLVAEASEQSERYRELRSSFDPRFEDSALSLNHTTLLDALDAGIAPAVAAVPPGRRDPHEIFLTDRPVLDETLRSAETLLPQLSAAARDLARTCARPEPKSIADVDDLLASANWLLETPGPPVGWLDRSAYAHDRVVALDARDRYTAYARQRATLSARYTESLLALDIPALAARFCTLYPSPLRFLWPSYYADVRALRACLRDEQRQAHNDWQADVLLAEQLQVGEQALEQRRLEHAGALGPLFDGVQTDWQRVTAAILWTDRLSLYYPDGLPPEIARLATGQPRGLSTLRTQRDRLAEFLTRWHAVSDDLTRFFVPERVCEGLVDLADAELGTLSESLSGMHSALSNYWRAADALVACRREPQAPAPLAWSALCDDLRLAQSVAGILAWFSDRQQTLADLLGRYDAGLSSNWEAIRATIAWIDGFGALYSSAPPPEAVRRLVSGEGDLETLQRVGALAHDGEAALARIDEALRFSDTVLPRAVLLAPASSLGTLPLGTLRDAVAARLEHLPELERWVACLEQRRRCEALGLEGFVAAGLREGHFPRDLPDRYEKRFYQIWLDAVLEAELALRRFRGELHEQLIARFGQQDERHLRLACTRLRTNLGALRRGAVRQALSDTMTPLGAAYSALRREVNNKRHPAIRQIVRRTGPALVRLKPCWMMSPLSISQYVESGDQLFDVVIFDEASQVCPEDAICAIFRGAQLIVVGDEKQLPPTRFFTAAYAGDEDEDDAEGAPSSQNERTASILEECDAAFPDRRMLRWHYRSRHESLIAFSNAHFYHNALQTFPGPQTEHAEGVRFEYVGDGVYDRGGSHTNKIEAARVVDLAIEHLRRHPQTTLGVVTMSQSQQQAVRDEIERRLKRDRTLGTAIEQQLEENDDHGFFVKNLESVQGDERDVILLSIGYGYDAPPEHPVRKLTLNFGPVNREGGERRLNVAVTRAREQVVLVASIRAADLPPNMASAGARTLRDYLAYAEQGPGVLTEQVRALSSDGARSGFDSPFEEAVYDALTARGLTLTSQVGCAGYYIDLAVRDPSHPERYLLGIECDGATYHSAKTARDRDRLRQQQLERLGWHIHRIWSRDWVHDQTGEIDKVFHALDQVRQGTPVAVAVLTVSSAQQGASASEPIPFPSRPQAPHLEREAVTPAGEQPDCTDELPHRAPPNEPSRPRWGDGQPTTPEPVRHPVPLSTAAHICEACAFYQFHTNSRFYCGHDAAYKLRDPKGRTAGCPAWRRRA
ncbi:MAG TPA: DUF4011 domain-containing protein [Ktedonobacterales bacterium]